MITQTWAEDFAQAWATAWNTGDLDTILSHYTHDVVMTSPKIVRFSQQSDGTVNGKAALRAYWQDAIARVPTRQFQVIDVLVSVNSIVIYYQSTPTVKAAELMIFNADGMVERSIAHYAPLP